MQPQSIITNMRFAFISIYSYPHARAACSPRPTRRATDHLPVSVFGTQALHSFAPASLALVFPFSSPTAAQTSPSSPSRPFQYRDTLNGFYPPPDMSVADENSPYRVILQRILATYPRLPADENLIQALLLVLVAKQKHLIIRTPDSDVSKVLKQTVNILHRLFNLSVIKLKLHRSHKLSQEAFLRLLLLDNSSSPRGVGHYDLHEVSETAGKSVPMLKRNSTCPQSVGSAGIEGALFPADDSQALTSPASPATQVFTISEEHESRRSLARAQTDPILYERQQQNDGSSSTFPQAVAISGLEDCSEQVQRALWTTLSTRKVQIDDGSSGPRTLPDDFFVIYVCPYGSPYGRPLIHKSLLDRFSMSITIPPSTKASSEVVRPFSADSELRPKVVVTASDIGDLRRLAAPSHTFVHERLDLYLSDLLSAARHHPHLDSVLLTVRCRQDIVELVRAWRVLFGAAQSRLDHMLDVTDGDIRNVFIKAVQHRLRVLEGPQAEILASATFTATGKLGKDAEWETGRREVREILKEIVEVV